MMEGKTESRVTRVETHQDTKPVSASASVIGTTSANGSSAHVTTQTQYAVSSGFDASVDASRNQGTTATINPATFRNSTAAQEPSSEYGSALRDCVAQSLRHYFKDLNGERPEGLYNLVINEIEYPLLITVMSECDQNQSRAAQVLGINRNTLRKKLKHHGIV